MWRLFLLCCFGILGGCAVGNEHRYHDVMANLDFRGTTAVAVTTHDQRKYVLSGDKRPDFVGLQRGGYGNPFDVTTASGRPLAEDISRSIVSTLDHQGFRAFAVMVSPRDSRQEVIDKLKASSGDRLFLLTLREWKSDTYTNTALIYDVKAEVLDPQGEVLAEKEVSGRDNLGGSFWNPPGHAKRAVPEALKRIIEDLLNNPKLGAALQLAP